MAKQSTLGKLWFFNNVHYNETCSRSFSAGIQKSKSKATRTTGIEVGGFFRGNFRMNWHKLFKEINFEGDGNEKMSAHKFGGT